MLTSNTYGVEHCNVVVGVGCVTTVRTSRCLPAFTGIVCLAAQCGVLLRLGGCGPRRSWLLSLKV